LRTIVRFTLLGAGALTLLTAAVLSAATGAGASALPGIVHQSSVRGDGSRELQPGDDRGQDGIGAAVAPEPQVADDSGRGRDQDQDDQADVRDELEPADDNDRQQRGPDAGDGVNQRPSCDRGPGSNDSRGPGSGSSRGPGSGACRH
jgi:hypothetical protein